MMKMRRRWDGIAEGRWEREDSRVEISAHRYYQYFSILHSIWAAVGQFSVLPSLRMQYKLFVLLLSSCGFISTVPQRGRLWIPDHELVIITSHVCICIYLFQFFCNIKSKSHLVSFDLSLHSAGALPMHSSLFHLIKSFKYNLRCLIQSRSELL